MLTFVVAAALLLARLGKQGQKQTLCQAWCCFKCASVPSPLPVHSPCPIFLSYLPKDAPIPVFFPFAPFCLHVRLCVQAIMKMRPMYSAYERSYLHNFWELKGAVFSVPPLVTFAAFYLSQDKILNPLLLDKYKNLKNKTWNIHFELKKMYFITSSPVTVAFFWCLFV